MKLKPPRAENAPARLYAMLGRLPDGLAHADAELLTIARTLADTGRLAPTDAYFVETLEQRLAAARGSPATSP
jgi:hypothetical protein